MSRITSADSEAGLGSSSARARGGLRLRASVRSAAPATAALNTWASGDYAPARSRNRFRTQGMIHPLLTRNQPPSDVQARGERRLGPGIKPLLHPYSNVNQIYRPVKFFSASIALPTGWAAQRPLAPLSCTRSAIAPAPGVRPLRVLNRAHSPAQVQNRTLKTGFSTSANTIETTKKYSTHQSAP